MLFQFIKLFKIFEGVFNSLGFPEEPPAVITFYTSAHSFTFIKNETLAFDFKG